MEESPKPKNEETETKDSQKDNLLDPEHKSDEPTYKEEMIEKKKMRQQIEQQSQ